RTERAAYRTKFYSNLSSPTRFDEEPFNTKKETSERCILLRKLATSERIATVTVILWLVVPSESRCFFVSG
ncbi:hypothetical protein P7E15_15820, partial [Enterococcus gallinarum]|nr:hypothetical protein [Enterococcus gallinarum]